MTTSLEARLTKKTPFVLRDVDPTTENVNFLPPYLWLNREDDKLFFLTDVTAGVASWIELALAEGTFEGELHIPDRNTTANSFHTNATGDSWWGCTENDFNSDHDNATSYVLKTGVSKFQNVTATGGTISGFTIDVVEGFYIGAAATRIQIKPGSGIWAGATAIGDAPFSVTNAGVLSAISGAVGGWTLSETALTGTGVTLSSTGDAYISVGTTPPTAPAVGTGIFIDKTGLFGLNADTENFKLDATNGHITAIAGTVGGWTLTSDKMSTGADSDYIGLEPLVGIQLGDSTFADAPFSVTPEGVLKAVSGSVGGWALSATALSSSSIVLDHANDRIRSSDYVTGIAGPGFTLESDLFESSNVRARGLIRTGVFQADALSAIGGDLIVSPADVLAVDMTASDGSGVPRITESGDTRITEDGNTRILETSQAGLTIDGNETFSIDDILRISNGIDDEWMSVESVSGAAYGVSRDLAGDYAAGSNPAWAKGASVVNYGQSGDGAVFMTASESNAPYISVLTHEGEPWDTVTTGLRMGNLNGFLGYTTDKYGIGVGDSDGSLRYDPTGLLQILAGQTAYNTGLGLYVGYDTDAWKLSLGDPDGDYLTWDGETLTVNVSGGSTTDLSWTAGTTAGPRVNSSSGADAVIPSASGTASGAVTTAAQTFAGAKTFSSTIVGSINGSAATAANITVAATTDTTCSVGLWDSATGSQAPKSDAGLTYNASTNALTCTGTINGATLNSTSARSAKKNIVPFTKSALNIVNATDICSFNFKADKSNLYHVGFIADDTNPILSTEKQNSVDHGNSIGVLLKAVQELSVKNMELYNRLSMLEGVN